MYILIIDSSLHQDFIELFRKNPGQIKSLVGVQFQGSKKKGQQEFLLLLRPGDKPGTDLPDKDFPDMLPVQRTAQFPQQHGANAVYITVGADQMPAAGDQLRRRRFTGAAKTLLIPDACKGKQTVKIGQSNGKGTVFPEVQQKIGSLNIDQQPFSAVQLLTKAGDPKTDHQDLFR